MKLKKILACVSAAALTVSAMAVSAFAESEELTGPVSFNWCVGYNQAETGAWIQADPDNEAVKTYTDILLTSMTVTNEDGEEETKNPGIQWCTSTDWEGNMVLNYTVATAEDENAHTGEIAITSTGGWWQQGMLVNDDNPLADFLGDVDPADVTSISFALVYAPADEPVETDPEETDPEETDPEETDPEETDPEETDPEETDPEETTDAAGDVNGDKTDDKNQPTGVVLAIVPAAVAATAVVIAKKRK